MCRRGPRTRLGRMSGSVARRELLERDADLTRLRDALDDARAGAGRLVLVSGEAGIGKTTLVRPSCPGATERPVRILRGGCDDLVTPRALGPSTTSRAPAAGPADALRRGQPTRPRRPAGGDRLADHPARRRGRALGRRGHHRRARLPVAPGGASSGADPGDLSRRRGARPTRRCSGCSEGAVPRRGPAAAGAAVGPGGLARSPGTSAWGCGCTPGPAATPSSSRSCWPRRTRGFRRRCGTRCSPASRPSARRRRRCWTARGGADPGGDPAARRGAPGVGS